MSDRPLPKYLNHIPRTTLIRTKMSGIMADMQVISDYLEEGCYAAEDIASLMERVETLAVSVSEMRMGIEVTADARCVSDEEYEDMIDEEPFGDDE